MALAPYRAATVPIVADEQLETYRSSIDNIDAALILLLAERFKVTRPSAIRLQLVSRADPDVLGQIARPGGSPML